MLDYKKIIDDVKSKMTNKDIIKIGKTYMIAPNSSVAELSCDGEYLGKYCAHNDWWAQYGKGGIYKLDEKLLEDALEHSDEIKLVVRKIASDLAGIEKPKAKPRKSQVLRQFVVDDERFITNGRDVLPKYSYDALVEIMAEDNMCLNLSYSAYAEELFKDGYYTMDTHAYYNPCESGCYYDDDKNEVYVIDYDEELYGYRGFSEDTTKKIVAKVLDIRHKYFDKQKEVF